MSDVPDFASSPRSVREQLLAARARGQCALIPYLTLGYPSLEASLALLDGLEEMGVDAVEIGIPFSDPVADGPTIQGTIEHALREGVTLRRVLDTLQPSSRTQAGARVLFSYCNPLLAYGLVSLPVALRACGVGSALITDMVPEEAAEWVECSTSGGIERCFLVASTSDTARLEQAARLSTGFVYCVATLGVTGSRTTLDDSARATVERLRASSDAPVGVGFGLSAPADIRRVRDFADGAVVGSALMRALGDAVDPPQVRARGVEFIAPLLEAARA